MTHANHAVDYANANLSGLVQRVQDGDQEGYRHLIQRCNQRLFRVARAVLNDDMEAEDALQESWLKAYGHIQSFRSESNVTTWLTRIVLNECHDRLRTQRSRVALDEIEPGMGQVVNFPTRFGMEDPSHRAGRVQARELIERAIETLPEIYRVVFMMRAVEEYSTEETANVLGVRAEVVKTRLHRARNLLRKALHETLEPVLHESFSFLGLRCARITQSVMQQLADSGDHHSTKGDH